MPRSENSPLSLLSKLSSSPLNFIQHKSFLRNFVSDMHVYSYFSLSTDKCVNNLFICIYAMKFVHLMLKFMV